MSIVRSHFGSSYFGSSLLQFDFKLTQVLLFAFGDHGREDLDYVFFLRAW